MYRTDVCVHIRVIPLMAIVSVVVLGCETRAQVAEQIMEEMEPDFDHLEYDPTTLHAETWSEQDFLALPRYIEVIGDHVVVSDRGSERLIHVFHRSTKQHVVSFGRHGEAPGEFVTTAIPVTFPDSDEVVGALEPSYRHLTRFRLPDGEIVPFGAVDAVQLPTLHFVYQLEMIEAGRGVGLGFFEQGRLGFFDLDSGRANFAGVVPGDTDEAFVNRQQAYQAYLTLNPARTRVAVATRLAGDIDIYDVEGGHLAQAATPYSFPVDYMTDEEGSFMPGPRNRHGYQGVTASDSAIFALFSGRAEAHFRGMAGSHSEFVHVFDWNGNLERVFRLDREVLDIALDETGSELYAITERPQPAVLVFSVM